MQNSSRTQVVARWAGAVVRQGWVILLLAVLAVPAGIVPLAQGQVIPGDSLVADSNAGRNLHGALFRVNPGSGNRTIFSDFGNPAQGPTAGFPTGVAVERSGRVLVIEFGAGTNGQGALFRVNPDNGERKLFSDFGDPTQGPTGQSLSGVALEASGQILISDGNAGAGGEGALFRVNPTNGNRVLVSDFGDPAQGPTGQALGVAVQASGQILSVGPVLTPVFTTAVFRVNPANGQRTLLSDFFDTSQGPAGVNPNGVAVEPTGQILVIDQNAGTGLAGALFRVNPSTGHRVLLSDLGNGNQGLGSGVSGVAVEPSGQILILSGLLLLRVDSTNGNRTPLSIFFDPAQGPLGEAPDGLAAVPGVPFSQFNPRLEIDLERGVNNDAFKLKGSLTLDARSDGIHPLVEPARIQVGNLFITIPTGSFRQDGQGRVEFEGVIQGATVEVVFQHLHGKRFAFEAEASGVDLSGTVNPVTLVLTIGNDIGVTSVKADLDQ